MVSLSILNFSIIISKDKCNSERLKKASTSSFQNQTKNLASFLTSPSPLPKCPTASKFEKKSPETDSSYDIDEDIAFFSSLLPYLKKLPPKVKLKFQMKVQKILFELAFVKNE